MSFNELILTVVLFSSISNPMLFHRSQLKPQSTALWNAAMASSSDAWPQEPPIALAPKLISGAFQPVRPSERYSASSLEFMMA
jgi:hypothetical protein